MEESRTLACAAEGEARFATLLFGYGICAESLVWSFQWEWHQEDRHISRVTVASAVPAEGQYHGGNDGGSDGEGRA